MKSTLDALGPSGARPVTILGGQCEICRIGASSWYKGSEKEPNKHVSAALLAARNMIAAGGPTSGGDFPKGVATELGILVISSSREKQNAVGGRQKAGKRGAESPFEDPALDTALIVCCSPG
jgi:hypothetical protein